MASGSGQSSPRHPSGSELRTQQAIRNVSATNGSSAVAIFTTGNVNLPHVGGPQVHQDSHIASARTIRHRIYLTDPEVDRECVVTAKGERTPGTCEWVKDHELYQQWLNTDSQRLLWISGGPGMGKTVLSVFLTYELERLCAQSGDEVIYYFCGHDDEHRRSALAILRGLMYRLLMQREDLASAVEPYLPIDACGSRIQGVLSSFETLWIMLRAVMDRFDASRRLYILLDGLDECDDDSIRLLASRLRRSASLGPNCRLVIVSRDLPALRGLPQLRLDPDHQLLVQSDVGRFISHEANQLSATHNLEPSLCNTIKAELLERAEGTFLWVGLAIRELTRQSTATQILRTLKALPRGLDSIFMRILLQIDENERSIAALVLRCVVVAVRPLTVMELASILGTQAVSGISAEQAARDAITLCGNILTCIENRITVVHSSAKDYLLKSISNCIAEQPALHDFEVDSESAHLELAQTCLRIIEGSDFRRESFGQDLDADFPDDSSIIPNHSDDDTEPDITEIHYELFPLLEYASMHWLHHATQVSSSPDQLFVLQRPFFQEHSTTRKNWLRAYIHHKSYRGQSLSLDSALLVVAARFNLLNLVRTVLGDFGQALASHQMNGPHHSSNTTQANTAQKPTLNEALCVACAEGHLAVADRLLRGGADAEGQGYSGFTPLGEAASAGHESVMKLLVDYGLDVTQRGYEAFCNSAFLQAVSRGDERAVRMHLNAPVKIDLGPNRSEQSASVLGSAWNALSGSPPQVRHKIKLETKNSRGQTALHLAAQHGYFGILVLLLDNKAHVDARSNAGRTPLHEAVIQGNSEAVRILLRKEPRCDDLDEYGRTPLHSAVIKRFRGILELLLKGGADVDLRDGDGYTPLALASRMGYNEMVTLLLDYGAKDYGQGDDPRAGLILAAGCGHRDVVEVLLRRRVIADDGGRHANAALQEAADFGHADVVKCLLDGGAPINRRGSDGLTALAGAALMECESIVKLLLHHGADVDIPDFEGCTALMLAIKLGHRSMEHLLLQHGAVVSDDVREKLERDRDGWSRM